jgi:hypothetical protein
MWPVFLVALGIALGRFAVSLLEVKTIHGMHLTAKAGSGECFWEHTVERFWMGRWLGVTDGGVLLKCNERRQIGEEVMVYCECL